MYFFELGNKVLCDMFKRLSLSAIYQTRHTSAYTKYRPTVKQRELARDQLFEARLY